MNACWLLPLNDNSYHQYFNTTVLKHCLDRDYLRLKLTTLYFIIHGNVKAGFHMFEKINARRSAISLFRDRSRFCRYIGRSPDSAPNWNLQRNVIAILMHKILCCVSTSSQLLPGSTSKQMSQCFRILSTFGFFLVKHL